MVFCSSTKQEIIWSLAHSWLLKAGQSTRFQSFGSFSVLLWHCFISCFLHLLLNYFANSWKRGQFVVGCAWSVRSAEGTEQDHARDNKNNQIIDCSIKVTEEPWKWGLKKNTARNGLYFSVFNSCFFNCLDLGFHENENFLQNNKTKVDKK